MRIIGILFRRELGSYFATPLMPMGDRLFALGDKAIVEVDTSDGSVLQSFSVETAEMARAASGPDFSATPEGYGAASGKLWYTADSGAEDPTVVVIDPDSEERSTIPGVDLHRSLIRESDAGVVFYSLSERALIVVDPDTLEFITIDREVPDRNDNSTLPGRLDTVGTVALLSAASGFEIFDLEEVKAASVVPKFSGGVIVGQELWAGTTVLGGSQGTGNSLGG